MKKYCLFVVFAIVFSFKSNGEEKKYKVACVGFYNLENLFDTINDPNKDDEEFLPNGSNRYTGDVYKDKLSKLSDVISLIGTEVSPDGVALLGTAEIENAAVLQDLINMPKLKNRNYKVVHHEGPDVRSVDCGLIYNPKYFTVNLSKSLFVELFDADGSPRYTRDVLYVYGMFNGEPLHVFVNHWPSRRGGEEISAPGRAKAAGVCKHSIDSILKLSPDAKIIVMGDLNDDPTNLSVAKVLGAKGDKNDVEPGGLYNPWVDYLKKGIGTLAYGDSWNLFDQIILSSAFLNKEQKGFFLKEAKIFSKPWMLQQSGNYKNYPKRTYDFNVYAGGYSDHFPTYCILLKQIEPTAKTGRIEN